MRIARFAHSQGIAFGAVEGEMDAGAEGLTISAIAEHPFGSITFTGERWALSDVRLLAPILPTKIIGVGRNYLEHADEMGEESPQFPLLFLKPSTAVIGPNDTIRLPPDSTEVHYEGELAVVIGRVTRSVPHDRALTAVLGYTCGNDVTARDQQESDGQWTRAKGHDSFAPLGPWVETAIDPSDLAIKTELDGEVRQDSRTSLMRHDVATLVSYASSVMTLLPGDVIMTGTPSGVGPMASRQTVNITIEGIGTLRNLVVAP